MPAGLGSPTWRRARRQRSLLSRRPSWRWCRPGCPLVPPRTSITCSCPPAAVPAPSDILGEEPSTWLPSSNGASKSTEGLACAARWGVLAGVLPSPRSLSFNSRASLNRWRGSCIALGSGLRLLRRAGGGPDIAAAPCRSFRRQTQSHKAVRRFHKYLARPQAADLKAPMAAAVTQSLAGFRIPQHVRSNLPSNVG